MTEEVKLKEKKEARKEELKEKKEKLKEQKEARREARKEAKEKELKEKKELKERDKDIEKSSGKFEFFSKYLNIVLKFLRSVKSEWKRVTWPSLDELKASTTIVALTLIVVSLFVYFVDYVFILCFNLLDKVF